MSEDNDNGADTAAALQQRVSTAVTDMIVAAGELNGVQWVGVLAALTGQVTAYTEASGTVTRGGEPITAEALLDSIHDGALAMLSDARTRAAAAVAEQRAAERDLPGEDSRDDYYDKAH